MEFIDGEPLDARVERGPLTLDEAVRLTTQIAQALEVAHEKDIVHRDIKAANVMLTKKGEAKVLDFGLAKTAHSTMLTRMGSTLGTVAYMSPEQARGEEVDGRTVFRTERQLESGNNDIHLDGSAWSPGVYWVRLRTESGMLTRSVVKLR
jgi:serine/threonine protein kinase